MESGTPKLDLGSGRHFDGARAAYRTNCMSVRLGTSLDTLLAGWSSIWASSLGGQYEAPPERSGPLSCVCPY